MAENKVTNTNTSGSFIGLALLIIFFWGEPDLADALVYHLMNGNVEEVER